jgi:6-pyruvoyltetrahydropterin/6-carboxytetrahydropterin synthase
MTHRITLERNTLRFAAAHFTTFGGDCEPIHGHNYDVFVEMEGDLTGDSWVLDFREAKRMVAAICKELDHCFLLPIDTTALHIEETGAEYEITFPGRRYLLPKIDVVVLPIDNTTAERLAEWLNKRIRSDLATLGASNIERLTVGVEEAPGQSGWFTSELHE